jgi:Glycosyltransferase family 9 (heptosyltransferase)
MLNYLMKRRVAREQFRNGEITPAEVERARNTLFSVFSRYGDGVIAFKVINEFMARRPDKGYYLLTSHQLRPYAEALVDPRAAILSVRKRSPSQLLAIIWRLKRAHLDLGFNPWGSRGESEFYLTLAKRFYTFTSLKFQVTDNLYLRARRYLGLPQPEKESLFALLEAVRHILVSPFSTDIRKSLGPADVKAMLAWLRGEFPQARLTLALAPGEEGKVGDYPREELFVFGKSEARSRQFLGLVHEIDLFVGVDAGPLHLADALGKPCFGMFGPTAPETILDAASHILPLRSAKLQGIFCAVQTCPDPHCLHALFQDNPEAHIYAPSLRLEQERTICRFLNPIP